MTDEIDSEPADRAEPAPRAGRAPVVVGIGASAAMAASLEGFFSSYVGAGDEALVLVMRHREALDVGRLETMLQKVDGLALTVVEDGTPIEGGRIYLCPSDRITTMSGGRFAVRQAEERPGERGTIDSFLVSLAEDRADESVGIILAGTGSDGTLGVASLKEQGGLAIAERTAEEAGYLAEGETAASLADFVLPASEIAEHVRIYVRHLHRLAARRTTADALALASSALSRVADVLRTRTGNDFHGYKQNTFLRRVQRRMLVRQIDDVDAYVEFLSNDRNEVNDLFNDLLIGVTQFFRDHREFEILESEVIPRLFEQKGSAQQIRIWVLGCATGEEAYSIGILLREHAATLDNPPAIQIFATDLDGRALASARVGRFRSGIEANVTPERLARWFVKEGDTYTVVKELREICIFSQHNVIRDAPFSKLDLVSCRNLLIYLNADLQNRVIPLFHFALLPERYLFLGNSENVTRHPKMFAPIDRRARIFKKLDSGSRLPPEFPISPFTRSLASNGYVAPVASNGIGLERRAQRIAERYAPAYVIIDAHMQVLHFSGRMGRFLEPSAGTATLDLMSLVHRDLRLELRAAIGKVLENEDASDAEQVQLRIADADTFVDITVEPLPDPSGPRNLVVLFKDGAMRPETDAEASAGSHAHTEQMERMEGELRSTRDRLQSTIEELESTNEELKSSNEEYQSLNEELQSANEELDTSREELQSINEELTTVNGELAHRVHELTRATSDLKNFLESTQIPTVFVDNDLNVMNFTPAITQVLHMVETDIGRPLAHIKARVPIDLLFDDARRVLRTLASTERELSTADHTRYIVRILPYRSVDNFIAGVVMTFVDVTAVTRAEDRQRLLLAELQHRVRNTLSVVRSVARRTAASSDSVEDYAMHLDGRLNAFARVQAVVTRDPERGIDLEMLIAEELRVHRAEEGHQVDEIQGPKVALQPRAAELIALAVHELTTNAVKYGALSVPDGHIRIDWDVGPDETGQDVLTFRWIESGVPMDKKAPRRHGFGSELLERTLAYELNGEPRMDFTPDGLHCTIRVPLNEKVVVRARG